MLRWACSIAVTGGSACEELGKANQRFEYMEKEKENDWVKHVI